ncbi:MAG: hypothetical protein R6U15_00925 [Candidatus Izemoplasmatales bacterium]
MNKLIKLIFINLLIMLIVFPFVNAKPPFQSSIDLNNELTIIYPKFDNYILNNMQPHFHIYNSTGYLVNNANCIFHIYNNSGKHILQDNLSLDSNNIDYYYDLNSSLFKKNSHYSFLVHCNNSNEAGFISGGFKVTTKGQKDVINQNILYVPIIFGIISFILLSLYKNMNEDHWLFKLLIIIFIPLIIVLMAGYTLTIADSYIGSNIVNSLYDKIIYFQYLFYVYVVVALFILITKHFDFTRIQKRKK